MSAASHSSSNKKPSKDDVSTGSLGNVDTGGKLDPNALPFNISDLSPDALDKIKAIIDSANAMLTPEEKKYNEDQKKRQIEKSKALEDALEKETRKEVFEIPKGSAKTYKFIGYDTEQYQELMAMGNQADDMKNKRTPEFLKLQIEVFKKTIVYSLEGMSMEVLNKLPKKVIDWLYLVMKDKNENPLPFDPNV